MQKRFAKSLTVGVVALTIALAGFGTASAKVISKPAKAETTKVAKTKPVKKVKAEKGHKRTLPGKVVGVAGSTITMKKGNTTFVIEAAGINPVNRKGATITIGEIKAGHKISVTGLVTGTTVSNITKLRDITLPVGTTTDTETAK